MNNQWFSKIAVWLVIALVLFTVFKQFDTRGAAGASVVGYSDFLEQVRNKQIKQAVIQEGQGGSTEIVAVTLRGLNGRRPRTALVSRIDDTHANPQAEWLRMGSPEYPHPRQVDALEVASGLVPERLEIAGDGSQASFTLPLPANAMALVRIEWEAA